MIFERKALRKIYGPFFDSQTNERRKLENYELQKQFQRPDYSLKNCRWVMRGVSKDPLVRQVIKEDPRGERPLGSPGLRWEDWVKTDIKTIESDIRWREAAQNRDRWQDL